MKKLLIVMAIVCAIGTAKAASVIWSVAGTAAQENYTVYLLTSLADKYESAEALAAASVDSASIVKSGRKYTTGDQTASDATITATSMKNAYYVIVSASDTKSYTYYKADMSSMVYDPDNQESASGVFNSIDAATILSSGTSANYAAVPEPTSGLLMLLGVAGLALRRRRA